MKVLTKIRLGRLLSGLVLALGGVSGLCAVEDGEGWMSVGVGTFWESECEASRRGARVQAIFFPSGGQEVHLGSAGADLEVVGRVEDGYQVLFQPYARGDDQRALVLVFRPEKTGATLHDISLREINTRKSVGISISLGRCATKSNQVWSLSVPRDVGNLSLLELSGSNSGLHYRVILDFDLHLIRSESDRDEVFRVEISEEGGDGGASWNVQPANT